MLLLERRQRQVLFQFTVDISRRFRRQIVAISTVRRRVYKSIVEPEKKWNGKKKEKEISQRSGVVLFQGKNGIGNKTTSWDFCQLRQVRLVDAPDFRQFLKSGHQID